MRLSTSPAKMLIFYTEVKAQSLVQLDERHLGNPNELQAEIWHHHLYYGSYGHLAQGNACKRISINIYRAR